MFSRKEDPPEVHGKGQFATMLTVNKRIFVACMLSKSIQKNIEAWKEAFPNLPVRFIELNNLHMTLIPPWYEEDIKRLMKRFEKATFATKRFTQLFDTLEPGPTGENPRLIWIAGIASKELVSLKKELEEMFKKKPEKRKFTAHATLARFHKNVKLKKPLLIKQTIMWKENIASVCLVESKLSSSGAQYKVLMKKSLNS